MSDKLMDTVPGGESSQYESIKTVTVPTTKDGGDFGDAETKVTNDNTGMNQAADSDRGEKTADNIRYGQNISESGQGGMTEGMGGDAMDGSYGEVPAQSQDNESAEDTRKESGYGGDQDMDTTIGG